jgi:glutamine amidotransferase/cyclase
LGGSLKFINAVTLRKFDFILQVLQQASEKVFVPLTVGGGIREFTDADGRHYSALDVAAEYFRSGADKVSIGGDAVFAAEEFISSGKKSGKSSIEQISWVGLSSPTLCFGLDTLNVAHLDSYPAASVTMNFQLNV